MAVSIQALVFTQGCAWTDNEHKSL